MLNYKKPPRICTEKPARPAFCYLLPEHPVRVSVLSADVGADLRLGLDALGAGGRGLGALLAVHFPFLQ